MKKLISSLLLVTSFRKRLQVFIRFYYLLLLLLLVVFFSFSYISFYGAKRLLNICVGFFFFLCLNFIINILFSWLFRFNHFLLIIRRERERQYTNWKRNFVARKNCQLWLSYAFLFTIYICFRLPSQTLQFKILCS